MKAVRYLLLGISVLLFCSCKQEPYSYDYLMTHPDILTRQYVACQKSFNTKTTCQNIQRAYQDFHALVTEAESDPIDFGEKILKAQMELAQLSPLLKNQQITAQKQESVLSAHLGYMLNIVSLKNH